MAGNEISWNIGQIDKLHSDTHTHERAALFWSS